MAVLRVRGEGRKMRRVSKITLHYALQTGFSHFTRAEGRQVLYHLKTVGEVWFAGVRSGRMQ